MKGIKEHCKERCVKYTPNSTIWETIRREPCEDCKVNGFWIKDEDGT